MSRTVQIELPGRKMVRCICGHHFCTHVFDEADSICSAEGCSCIAFVKWEVVLLSPDGNEYRIYDIERFVRKDFTDLFIAEDVIIKARPSENNRGGGWTNAETGLQKLAEDKINSWKGWTLITKPKTFKL